MNFAALENLGQYGELLVDLGLQPVSNRFLASDTQGAAPTFPLQLRICPETGLIYQGKPFPVSEVKPRYDWFTCFEPEDHLDDLTERLTTLPGVTPASTFGAYSFKDDTTLQRLSERGYTKQWRIDPEQDLGVSDRCANVETYQSLLTPAVAERIKNRRGAADVTIVRHVVEHAYNLPAFIAAIKTLTQPGGYIVWELPDCERALSAGDCTTIWEEHIFYFTEFTFEQLLLAAGLAVVHYESIPYPLENCIIAITQIAPAPIHIDKPDSALVSAEITRAQHFVATLKQRPESVRKKIDQIKRQHGAVALFGAGHLSVAYLSLMGIADLVDCVIDDNPHKKGMHMPVAGLPIVGSDELYSGRIAVCLLSLNPQNQPKIVTAHRKFVEQGGVFASIFPGSELDLEQLP